MTLQLGEHSYGSATVRAWHRSRDVVRVGRFCSLADHVTFIVDGNHRIDTLSSFPFRERLGWTECSPNVWGKETPSVGNDVWIASGATIYSGVHIGDGAVVAGQSIVTKSVPPYAVVAGNPARVVKYRFPPDVIEQLLALRWWDLPLHTIRERLAPHMDGDIRVVIDVLRQIRSAEVVVSS